MSPAKLQVVDDEPAAASTFSSDGGNGIDKRLRSVEQGITRLETELKHLATREFIYKTILGGMGIAAAIAGVIIKFWPSASN